MNSYTKHHIKKFHQKYINRNFCQDDIVLFLVLTRDYTKPNSIFRELGDFLAHPDKKDRGLIIKSFKEVLDFFEDNSRFVMDGGEIALERPSGLGTTEDIHASLCEIFLMLDLKIAANNKKDAPLRDFVFCLIFLLSNFKLSINSKLVEMTPIYSHGLSLQISYESTNLERNYLSLTVLYLDAVWIANINDTKKTLAGHIVRRFSNGFLGAIPYELDTPDLPHNMEEIRRGKVWPLPDLL